MQKLTLFVVILFVVTLFYTNISGQNSPEKIDTRIDNMGYWKRLAKEGKVPVAPVIPVKPAEFKTSIINAKSNCLY